MDDVTKLDLYDLLGISFDSTIKEIKTAYRKKALTCHPDKNPDNPVAVQLFHQLSRALEILTDAAARDAYDKILKARKAAELRNRQLDSKRKKFKEDLEKRERDAELQQQEVTQVDAAKKLQMEIERLRKEGSRQLDEEIQAMKQQLQAEQERLNAEEEDQKSKDSLPTLKVQWKHSKTEDGEYTHSRLMELFEKHGKVNTLVMSSKRRAIVEFADFDVAEKVEQEERGFFSNPLKISWISKPNRLNHATTTKNATESKNENWPPLDVQPDRDYESIVMMRLRQAEERKRLIQQMRDDDADNT